MAPTTPALSPGRERAQGLAPGPEVGQPPPPPEVQPGPAGRERARVPKRLLAHGLLAGMFVLSVACHLLEPAVPWLWWVRTMAEAGLAGGLADWFAVTALFRHPLGVPLPHTALIPAQHEKIASNLAGFLEPFLTEENLRRRLAGRSFAGAALDWVSTDTNADRLVGFASTVLAGELEVLGDADLQRVVLRQVDPMIESVPLAPTLGKVLGRLTAGERLDRLTTEGARIGADLLEDTRFRAGLDAVVRGQASGLWGLVKGAVGAWLARHKADELIGDLRQLAGDPLHPWRAVVRERVETLVDRLETDPRYRDALEKLKAEFLAPGVREFVATLTNDLRTFLLAHARDPRSRILRAIGGWLRELAIELRADSDLVERVDTILRDTVPSLIAQARPEITQIVKATMLDRGKQWLVGAIEQRVGEDLQMIRVNGTLVGAAAGLAIAAVGAVFR